MFHQKADITKRFPKYGEKPSKEVRRRRGHNTRLICQSVTTSSLGDQVSCSPPTPYFSIQTTRKVILLMVLFLFHFTTSQLKATRQILHL